MRTCRRSLHTSSPKLPPLWGKFQLPHNADDAASYQAWVKVQQVVESPLDRVGDFWRYVLSVYPYFRSRLVVPGRAYDTDEDGQLAIGGSAHCDVMDLDVKLAGMSDLARQTAHEWTLDSSPEQVAYWRGMGRGNSQRSMGRRRAELLDDLESAA